MRVEFLNRARTEAIVICRHWWFWRRCALVRDPMGAGVWEYIINGRVVETWIETVIKDAKKAAIDREPWLPIERSTIDQFVEEAKERGARGPLLIPQDVG